MKLMRIKIQNPFFVGIGFLLLLIITEFLVIMFLNNGLLVYTLDDPYIHLALAENIINGHYGVNNNEVSAPSSSILWPLIIAPFSSYEYSPFLINNIVTIITVIVLIKILYISVGVNNERTNNLFISSSVVLLILATNSVGLIFTGMEHSLQVLLVVLMVYGLIIEIENNKIEHWFLIIIVFAPLIRYENMAISIATLGYLSMRRYFKQVISVIILLVIFIGGFSLFLTSLGLDLLPTSVIAKSSVVGVEGKLDSTLLNLKIALHHQQGRILVFSLLVMLTYLLMHTEYKKKLLATTSIVAVCFHLVAGSYGWYHRYEIYIWTFVCVIHLYLFGPQIKKFLVGNDIKLITTITIASVITASTATTYILNLFSLPIASNNIYEQQYQMHRFVVEYYNMPIAVNDLGYVSYKNDNYVLDLGGLASITVLNHRRNNRDDSDWMQELSDEYNIGLVMIYDNWFKHIPNEWKKIGHLHLGNKRITAAYSEVAFYATNQNVYSSIDEKLQLFIKTLPPGVKFTFQKGDSD